MTPDEIATRLEEIAAAEDFARRSAELVAIWERQGVGVEAVSPILRFMEAHPALDFGTPGALVHFVERFYGRGYEGMVVELVLRRPTAHTAWMLNRLVNGAKKQDERDRLISVLRLASAHPMADPDTTASIGHFLEGLGSPSD